MYGRGGYGYLMRHGVDNPRPQISSALLRRVLGYARPYWWRMLLLLAIIMATIGLGLLTPLVLRDLIDRTLPASDVRRLNLLAAVLIAIPVANALLRIWQRALDAAIGSGIIFDLRCALYRHLQRMSMRFFTTNKSGELVSRLNNDVTGAQNAVTNTLVDVITNLISVAATLAVMLALEWRLTLLGMAVLPAFLLLGRRFAGALRDASRRLMEHNARLGAIMNETLNISGMLLVKLFGRRRAEQRRFGEQAAAVRDGSVHQAVVASRFFIFMGVATAVGTAAIYLVGGHLVIRGALTIGTVVAFSAYLAQLYGPLRSLSNVPVMVAQSLVSFERVFEVLDLPVDIEEAPDAEPLTDAVGHIEFRAVSFRYEQDARLLLSEAKRAARAEDMAFSGQRFGAESEGPPARSEGNGAGAAVGGAAGGPAPPAARAAGSPPVPTGATRWPGRRPGSAPPGTSAEVSPAAPVDGVARARGHGRTPRPEAASSGIPASSVEPDVRARAQASPWMPAAIGGTGASERGTGASDLGSGAQDAGAGKGRSREPAAHQAREWALEEVSFAVTPGQTVALVGPSGSGKTTLTYLVPRLYDVVKGQILLDGRDLRTLTVESLAAQVGMVTQEPYLFHDSVRANLRYAAREADDARIEDACRAANIHEFISALPAGYDTVVGERGYRLSGGEKQRLAIARVILKDPRVLILDEATSHLDTHAEALIQEALARVVAGRTAIIVAHRLSTIMAADLILVFDRGRIVERGTHTELLAARGLYQRLYQLLGKEERSHPSVHTAPAPSPTGEIG